MLLVLDNFEQLGRGGLDSEYICSKLPAAEDHCHFTRAPGVWRKNGCCHSKGCRARRSRIRIDSKRSMQCACLSRQPSVSNPHLSHRWKRRPSSISAGRWKDRRWRWSLQRHGRVCCRATRSPPSCARAPSCCMRRTPHIQLDTQASRSCSISRGDLLSATERDALSRLSVFHGGFYGRCGARRSGRAATCSGCASGQVSAA